MALSVVGTFRGSAINGADVTLTPPTLLEDDVVYIGGGFTNVGVQPGVSTAGFTSLSDQVSGAYRGRLMRKVQGAVPDTSFTGIGSGDGLDGASYIGIVLRGGDTATPEDAATIVVTAGAPNPNPGSITTVTDGACVVVITAGTSIDVAGVAISGYTISPGLAANDTRDSTANMARKENKTPAGAEDPAAWTGFSITDSVSWTIAVRPLVGAGVLVAWLDPAPPAQFPESSHYVQGWNSWYEPRKATLLRSGIGINVMWDHLVGADPSALMATLLATGIKATRINMNWNKLDRATNTLTGSNLATFSDFLVQAKALGIRPVVLLNADHGQPNPPQDVTRVVTVHAAIGATTVTLDSVVGLTPHFSGLNSLTTGKMCEVIFSAIDTGTRVCTLSKVLPIDIPASTTVTVGTFLYRPFTEPGHPEYNDTCDGWLNYVRALCNVVVAAGHTDFDVEIWNELTFGSEYLLHESYYDPPLFTPSPDNPYGPGGRVWEMGRRTVAMLRAEYPAASPIWGFTNTTFFNPGVENLPSTTAGQSYHPYSNGIYDAAGDFEDPGSLREGFAPPAPPYRVFMPENILTWLRWDSLTVYLRMPDRATILPPGVTTFRHYQTEQGIAPSEFGIATEAEANRVKGLWNLRALISWLHRGGSVMCLFSDVFGDTSSALQIALGFSLLTPAYASTPPLDAIGRLTALVAEAQDIASPATLTVDVGLSPDDVAFVGDGGATPDKLNSEILGVFPFQVSPTDWVVPTYIVTRDVLAAAMTPVTATIKLTGLIGTAMTPSAQNLLDGAAVAVTTVAADATSLTVSFLVSETPVALVLAGPAVGGQAVRTLFHARHRRVN